MSESNEGQAGGGGSVRDMRVAALRYNAGQDSAPVVVAAGSGYVARKIVEIADEFGISVYHDDNAATLLSGLKLGQRVPPELYQMVVDIYLSILTAAEKANKTREISLRQQITDLRQGGS